MTSAWDPAQYGRFAAEREQPFWDLGAMLQPVTAPRMVDLGCGDGRLTAELHRRIGAASTVGIDSSTSMLAEAGRHAGGGVSFRSGDIAASDFGSPDVVFSNAALQWVADHDVVLRQWVTALAPGGQLAVQMPANSDHPSHVVARELGAEWLGASAPPDPVASNVLPVERYAEILYALGCGRQQAQLRVYGHVLASSDDVVEWVKGTSLTRFKAVMTTDDYERFLAEYRRRLVAVLGPARPYFYTFKRILLWGRLPVPGS